MFYRPAALMALFSPPPHQEEEGERARSDNCYNCDNITLTRSTSTASPITAAASGSSSSLSHLLTSCTSSYPTSTTTMKMTAKLALPQQEKSSLVVSSYHHDLVMSSPLLRSRRSRATIVSFRHFSLPLLAAMILLVTSSSMMMTMGHDVAATSIVSSGIDETVKEGRRSSSTSRIRGGGRGGSTGTHDNSVHLLPPLADELVSSPQQQDQMKKSSFRGSQDNYSNISSTTTTTSTSGMIDVEDLTTQTRTTQNIDESGTIAKGQELEDDNHGGMIDDNHHEDVEHNHDEKEGDQMLKYDHDDDFFSVESTSSSFEQQERDLFFGCPDGNKGDGCSIFCPCSGDNTCEAWYHVCRAPGEVGESCHATKPCKKGLQCEAWNHKCLGPGKEGERCHATRHCEDGLTCEAGTHVCRAPGKSGDSCHLTRPCRDGLTCEAVSHKCRAPGKAGDPCHLTRPCGPEYKCIMFQCFPNDFDIVEDLGKMYDGAKNVVTTFGEAAMDEVKDFVNDIFRRKRHLSETLHEDMTVEEQSQVIHEILKDEDFRSLATDMTNDSKDKACDAVKTFQELIPKDNKRRKLMGGGANRDVTFYADFGGEFALKVAKGMIVAGIFVDTVGNVGLHAAVCAGVGITNGASAVISVGAVFDSAPAAFAGHSVEIDADLPSKTKDIFRTDLGIKLPDGVALGLTLPDPIVPYLEVSFEVKGNPGSYNFGSASYCHTFILLEIIGFDNNGQASCEMQTHVEGPNEHKEPSGVQKVGEYCKASSWCERDLYCNNKLKCVPVEGVIFRNEANSNLCLSVRGDRFYNGNKVWLYTCNYSKGQKWTIRTGTGQIRVGDNFEYCLSGGEGSKLYAELHIWKCDDNANYLRWNGFDNYGMTNGDIVSAESNGRVIGVASGCSGVASERQTELQNFIHSDEDTLACKRQQRWKLEEWSLIGSFHNVLDTNLCLDVKFAKFEVGNEVMLYTCNGSKAQEWKVSTSNMEQIRVGRSFEYCLSGGKDSKLYSTLTIADCEDDYYAPYLKWWSGSNHVELNHGSYITTRADNNESEDSNYVVGVASGCGGVEWWRKAELQNNLSKWGTNCEKQQKWSFKESSVVNRDVMIRNSLDNNLCLDVPEFKNNSKVRLYPCNRYSKGQLWRITMKGHVRIGTNFEYCLSGGKDNKRYTQLYITEKCQDDVVFGDLVKWIYDFHTNSRFVMQSGDYVMGVAHGCSGVASERGVELQDTIGEEFGELCSSQQQWSLLNWHRIGKFRNQADDNLCLSVKHDEFFDQNKVWLQPCNDSLQGQKWKIMSNGLIAVGENYEYCLSGGAESKQYAELHIVKCHNGADYFKWNGVENMDPSGNRISIQTNNLVIGVGSGCNGVASERKLELQGFLWDSGMCGTQQKWRFEELDVVTW